jgi:hypothetical protein
MRIRTSLGLTVAAIVLVAGGCSDTEGGVVKADYGDAADPTTGLWSYRFDAADQYGEGGSPQVVHSAEGGRPGGFRTLRVIGTRTARPAGAGAGALRVQSTANLPASCTSTRDDGDPDPDPEAAPYAVPCRLLVGYSTSVGPDPTGQIVEYTGISGNAFTGATGINMPIPAGTQVIAQSQIDDNGGATRAQLGNNSCGDQDVTFYCYRPGSRSLTTMSVRLPLPATLPEHPATPGVWDGGNCFASQIAQVKAPAPDGGFAPLFELVQSRGLVGLRFDADGQQGVGAIDYQAPRDPTGSGWIRLGFDVIYSADPGAGRYQFLADLDHDGTWDHVGPADAGRTLIEGGGAANLSIGPYQAGCMPPVSNDYDNVEVAAVPTDAPWAEPTGSVVKRDSN